MPRFRGTRAAAAGRLPQWTEDSFAGILLNVAAGRVANRFDFGGVNLHVDAACASSLAAVYQACSNSRPAAATSSSPAASIRCRARSAYLCFSKTQALSPRGRCRTFDATADGIAIAEGIAVVVLKRLADAERDGDRIYAVIKGVGRFERRPRRPDGAASGRPDPGAVARLRQAGYSPATVGLFEAHGTGTVAGDTAELETADPVACSVRRRRAHDHAIGSVKSMIGHTKATAGIAGLIKAALACYHKVLPPHAGG